MPIHFLLWLLGGLAMATPVLAQNQVGQDREDELRQQQHELPRKPQEQMSPSLGVVTRSAVGRAGQRQVREDVAPDVHPMKRISNRIENRIQSRMHNRIDEDYDPQANAQSPFVNVEKEERDRR